MKPTLRSVFLVALMVVGASSCASTSSGSSTGKGGAPGSGGTSSAGPSKSSGGAQGAGGMQETGGAPGEGGKQGTGGAASTGGIRARQITTRGFTFDVLESGSAGEPVLLLHGFPDTSLEWSGLMPVLSAAGYHCLAPDQRGYSPGARPTEVDAYKYEELVADAFAVGSELGERFHLVGHDWGANVGWLMLQEESFANRILHRDIDTALPGLGALRVRRPEDGRLSLDAQ